MTNGLKKKLQSVLWSYDINSLNLKRSKELVIQQVLNRGDWDLVRWLFKKYPESEIRKVVAKPRRGRWFAQPLNLWLNLPNPVAQDHTGESAFSHGCQARSLSCLLFPQETIVHFTFFHRIPDFFHFSQV